MRLSQKIKSVSWASEVNLCQVRLFGKNESDENLPPSFGQTQLSNSWRVKSSNVPLMKWRCPCRFEVNSDWEVVAGEESKEVTAQEQREMRVLEAVYPRPSSIPPNPSLPLNEEYSNANDEKTRVVPVTPIEDDDNTPNPTTSVSETSLAALTSVLTNRATGNMVDRGLLLKIFRDPKMIQQLVSTYHAQKMLSLGMPKEISFSAQNNPLNGTQYNIPSSRTPLPINNAHITMATNTRFFNPTPQIRMGRGSNPQPVVKDVNYYKSLIQQHGIERRHDDPLSQEQQVNVVKSKPSKKMKSCKYFRSPNGCRNGANCAYQHDESARNEPDVHSAKRMKLDGCIVGR